MINIERKRLVSKLGFEPLKEKNSILDWDLNPGL